MNAQAWSQLLQEEGGIQQEYAAQYATQFEKERLTADSLPMLNPEMLKTLGVNCLGDALAILRLGSVAAPPAAQMNSTPLLPDTQRFAIKAPAAKLPQLNSDMTSQQFRKFKTDWSVFLNITNLPDDQMRSVLYSGANDAVQNAIINTYPNFFSEQSDSDTLLGLIETIVTQKSNPMVHRMTFGNMVQGESETTQAFVVRLKATAQDCNFSCPKCHHDLSTIYIKDQVIRGMANDTLQTDILAKAESLPTLDKVVKHAEAFEAALRDQSKMTDSAADVAAARTSAYAKKKKQYTPANSQSYKPANTQSQGGARRKRFSCKGCGSNQHGAPGAYDRETSCPAWGKTCSSCQLRNHFASVCSNKACVGKNNSPVGAVDTDPPDDDDTVASMGALMAHVIFDSVTNSFTNQSEDCVEEIDAIMIPFSLNNDTRDASDIPKPTQTLQKIFPDSGAKICLGGPNHLSKMGLTARNLLPTNKTVRAVGNFIMTCMGWLPVRFVVSGRETSQKLYICQRVDRLYFSEYACREVGILSPHFPHPSHPVAGLAVDPPKADDAGVCLSVSHQVSDSATQPIPASPQVSGQTDQIQQDSTSPKLCGTSKAGSNHVDPAVLPNHPTMLPFLPTEENIDKLKDWLLDAFASTAFNNEGVFPAMSGPPAHIHLREGAVPKARHKPIPVPFHLKEATKQALQRDVERGIIAPVPVGMATEWCSVMVITPKKDGSPRRTVDFQYLNSQCHRETHHTESPFHLALQVPTETYKTVLDSVDGYHSVPLDTESQPLTTFITEWGRFMYLRMPQGYLASGDAYTRRYDDIIQEVPRKVKCVDDALLHQDSIEGAFYQTFDYLTLCAQNGIVKSRSKFQFCQKTAQFAGLQVTPTGVAPSASMLSAIQDFPTPANITDARSWFGLVNQVAWAYSLGPIMQPFRDLVKHNSKFQWNQDLENSFQHSKNQIVSLVRDGIATFDVSRTTCLAPDWSKSGMGFLLLQKYCECANDKAPTCCPDGWRLVFAGSRFCTPAESRYAPIEGEAASIAWSLHKCRMFVTGCSDLIVTTDHRPLLGVLGNRDLGEIANPRLYKIKEKTLRYRFRIQHREGKWHRGSDAVSRNPAAVVKAVFSVCLSDPTCQDVCEVEVVEDTVRSSTLEALEGCQDEFGVITPDIVRAEGRKDASYVTLIATIHSGFPQSRSQTDASIRAFWEVRHRLSVDNDLVLLDSRIVIPTALRKRTLRHLHAAHQGVVGMKARANQSFYWPGLDGSIRNYHACCAVCCKIAPTQPREPIVLTPAPEWPFQHICMDMMELEHHGYLACSDRFTGWLLIYHLRPGEITASQMMKICREIFQTYGAPEVLSTDGQSIFTAHVFQEFLSNWGVSHRLSSADYAQSNGRAELAVKAGKRMIRENANPDGSLNNDKIAQAVLQYRNTPIQGLGFSPAQLLLHRHLRDAIPTPPRLYKPHKDWVVAAEQREAALSARNAKLVQRYNQTAHPLPQLAVGDTVSLQNKRNRRWDRTGRVVERLPNRQYRVRVDGSGRITLRNRRFLRIWLARNPPQPLPGSIPVNDELSLTDTDPPADGNDGAPSIMVSPQSPSNVTVQGETLPQSPDAGGGSSSPSLTPLSPKPQVKVPRALTNLLPFNEAGPRELLPPRRPIRGEGREEI